MKPRSTPHEQPAPPVPAPRKQASGGKAALPEPAALPAGLREALEKRRSVREYSREPLRLEELSALLWAAQGITAPGGLRTAPSAGAIYPVKSYVVVSRVQGLAPGFYSFDPDTRSLTLLAKGDRQKRLAKACGDQQCVEDCAAGLLLTAWYGGLRKQYGDAAEALALLEAGHIGQNWHLAAAALGLGSVSIGKIDPPALKLLLPIPDDEHPLYLLIAGRR
ncbi:MAG: SagB/ThcOx family dehydrogenase [Bryobacteraceae bacterium]|nr:SagB/ThcOx family dehydrogenase [Bryobacteraceae bacterium]